MTSAAVPDDHTAPVDHHRNGLHNPNQHTSKGKPKRAVLMENGGLPFPLPVNGRCIQDTYLCDDLLGPCPGAFVGAMILHFRQGGMGRPYRKPLGSEWSEKESSDELPGGEKNAYPG